MSGNPLVSIIVPTYNYANYIPDALRNLQSQDYQEVEIIIIDDGSTDHTGAIVAEFIKKDPRIKYYFQENAGLSAARNLGLEKAKGDYIQFLDSDDLISPAKLSQQVKHFEQNKTLAISYTNAYYFSTEKPDLLFTNLNLSNEEWMPKVSGNGYALLCKLIQQNIMPVNAVLIKKEVLKGVFFDTSLKSLEDWDVWLCLAFRHFTFGYLPDSSAYALVRVHPTSMSQNRERMYDYEINLRLRVEQQLKENSWLTALENKELNRINLRRIKILLSLIIKQVGFFSFNKLGELLRRTSAGIVLKSYLKAINDRRFH